jgi:thiamine kinase-like enzyme
MILNITDENYSEYIRKLKKMKKTRNYNSCYRKVKLFANDVKRKTEKYSEIWKFYKCPLCEHYHAATQTDSQEIKDLYKTNL